MLKKWREASDFLVILEEGRREIVVQTWREAPILCYFGSDDKGGEEKMESLLKQSNEFEIKAVRVRREMNRASMY